MVQESPRVYPWVSIEDEDTGQQDVWCPITDDSYSCFGSFRAPWGEQLNPQVHHFYAQLWHVDAGQIVPGPRSSTVAIQVLPADLSIRLEASPPSVRWYDTVTVTATMNRDVGETPYHIELYNQDTDRLVAWCTSGTSCSGSEWYSNIDLNDNPQPQHYIARLVRPGEPDGSVSDVLSVDIRRRLFPISLTLADYDSGFRVGTATTEDDELPGSLRVVFRRADGGWVWECQYGQEQCSFYLREGDAYRATVEDVHDHVFGRTPLYTVGVDDPEILKGSDVDLGDLAQMLGPVGVNGVCEWLLARNDLGTHVAEASVSDQWLACDAARAAGKALLATLVAIAAVEHSDDVIWFLYHQGVEEQTDTPPQDPENPVPDPVRVPPVFPIGWPVHDLSERLLSRSQTLTQAEADTLARTCLWLASAAAINGAQKCGSLPIFASGSEVPQATQHDLEALAEHPQWVLLNYEGPNKPGSGWQSDLCDPPKMPGQQCDEYPFLATLQGGPNAVPTPHLKAISGTQNMSQGGKYGSFVTSCGLTNADPFLGIPIHPSAGIPTIQVC